MIVIAGVGRAVGVDADAGGDAGRARAVTIALTINRIGVGLGNVVVRVSRVVIVAYQVNAAYDFGVGEIGDIANDGRIVAVEDRRQAGAAQVGVRVINAAVNDGDEDALSRLAWRDRRSPRLMSADERH